MNTNQPFLKILFRSIAIIGVILTIIFCIYGYRLGIFHSTDMLALFISEIGYFGAVVFIIIQIVQVVIPIVPGGISLAAGVIIFGPVHGFLYNYIGIVIGSIINFLLARRFGKSFIQSVISKRTYEKYIGWLDKGARFDRLFAIAILLPVAPDDYLCMLAGLTKMTLKKFIMIILLCKPLSILAYSFSLVAMIEWLTNMLK